MPSSVAIWTRLKLTRKLRWQIQGYSLPGVLDTAGRSQEVHPARRSVRGVASL